MKGLPATSISDFGILSVTGRKRVARPPARIAMGKLSGQDNFRLFEVESEPHFLKPGLCHRVAQLVTIRSIKHQKSFSACANEFTICCPVSFPQLIPFVNSGIAHSTGTPF